MNVWLALVLPFLARRLSGTTFPTSFSSSIFAAVEESKVTQYPCRTAEVSMPSFRILPHVHRQQRYPQANAFILDKTAENALLALFASHPEKQQHIMQLIEQCKQQMKQIHDLEVLRDDLFLTNDLLSQMGGDDPAVLPTESTLTSLMSSRANSFREPSALLTKPSSSSYHRTANQTILPRRSIHSPLLQPWSNAVGNPVPEDEVRDASEVTAPAASAAAGADVAASFQLASSEREAPPGLGSDDVLQLCLHQRRAFVDPAFPPCPASLYRPGRDAFEVAATDWGRPRSWLPWEAHGQERLFTEPPLPATIASNPQLPNNAFLSAVSLLGGSDPHSISNLFDHPDGVRSAALEHLVGVFRVNMCLSGWWRSVLVDDHVPVAARHPLFARSRSDLRALWLPILEKAYAKSCGSYAAMLERSVGEILTHLSGAPCYSLHRVRPSSAGRQLPDSTATVGGEWMSFVDTWGRLREGQIILTAHPLAAVSAPGKAKSVHEGLGLTAGTVVTVLGVESVLDGEPVVRLRRIFPLDPQHRRSSDEFWKAEHKSLGKAQHTLSTNEDNTICWIALRDVPTYFSGGFWFYPTVSWVCEVRAKGVFLSGVPSVAMQIEVSYPTHAIFLLSQPDPKASAGLAPAPPREDRKAEQQHSHYRLAHNSLLNCMLGMSLVLTCGMDNREGDAQRVLRTSSHSPDIFVPDHTDLCFEFQREVAIGATLKPGGGPYYLIPRAVGQADDTPRPYVLTVISKEACIGRSSPMTVRFVRVDSAAPLFASGEKSNTAVALQPMAHTSRVAAPYQYLRKCYGGSVLYNKGTDVV